jgi:hypothetical protein
MIVNDGYAKVSVRQIIDEVRTSASGAGKAWITKYSCMEPRPALDDLVDP